MKKVLTIAALQLGLVHATAFGNGVKDTAQRSIKLFEDPDHALTGCDVSRRLKIIQGFAGPIAVLAFEVVGFCEIHVEPKARTYDLKLRSVGSCGDKLYESTSDKGHDDLASLFIRDWRDNHCRMPVKNEIQVREQIDGQVVDFFSLPRLSLNPTTYSGRLELAAGIGGETTGFLLVLGDRSHIEVQFSTPRLRQAASARLGRRVVVTGYLDYAYGIERGTYLIIDAIALN